MSKGETIPAKITITVSATTATPHPPGLSDGSTTLPVGGSGDADFTTGVVSGQSVQFVGALNATLSRIAEGPGSDIFSTNPTPDNRFTGIIGDLLKDDTREYTIYYTVTGHKETYHQDPKLQMR